MGEPTFRPMTEADVEAVLKIEFSAFSHLWTRGIFLDCIKSGYECWLMFLGDQQGGHGVLSGAGGGCHLVHLAVKPGSQSKGLGGNVPDHLLLQGRGRGAETAFLEVRESNQPAIRLYERTGFNEIGRRRGYYPAVGGREDALVMAYTLLD